MRETSAVLLCFVFSFISSFAQNNSHKGYISGTIQLDSTWNQTVYLSHISDLSKMYSMSRSMIIAQSPLNDLGQFRFNLDFLPEEDQLYRMHISKAGSAEASIIIGGEAENHFFLIANNKSIIELKNNKNILTNLTIYRDYKNQLLRDIDQIVKLIDSTNYYASSVKSAFVENAFNSQLRKIADTCNYPLVSLYALERSHYESDISENLTYYQSFLNKWEDQNSPYFETIRSNIPKQKENWLYYVIYALGILLAFIVGYSIKQLSLSRKSDPQKLIKTLSVQERRIFELLQNKHTNKEISEELHIGINTVKSHVSNILNKLKVKSRKDILNLK